MDSVDKKGFKDYLYSALPYLLTAALGFCVGAYVTGWYAGDNDNAGRIDELTADIQRIEQQQSAIAETLQRAVGAIERAEQHSASIAEGISELKDRAGTSKQEQQKALEQQKKTENLLNKANESLQKYNAEVKKQQRRLKAERNIAIGIATAAVIMAACK